MKLAAYLRVSTDRQAEQGQGLNVQEAAIRRWAKANRHAIEGWYRDEGVSGSNGVEGREALPDALSALSDGRVEGVVVYNLDRLARKLTVQEAILAHIWGAGGRVFSIGDGGEVLEDDPDDPMRTAIRQMRGVFAQLERAMIAKRLRDGRRQKAEGGGFAYGSPPYGFKAEGGQLVEDEAEYPALDQVRKLRRQKKSLREIAAALDAAGFRPRKAEKFSAESVRQIVARIEMKGKKS